MSQVAQDRLLLGPAAVLSPSEAGRLLPVARSTAVAWLRGAGLVRLLCGREVVIWGDVLDALREGGIDVGPAPRRRLPEGVRLANLE